MHKFWKTVRLNHDRWLATLKYLEHCKPICLTALSQPVVNDIRGGSVLQKLELGVPVRLRKCGVAKLLLLMVMLYSRHLG